MDENTIYGSVMQEVEELRKEFDKKINQVVIAFQRELEEMANKIDKTDRKEISKILGIDLIKISNK